MTHGGRRVKGGMPIEATQDGLILHRKTAAELCEIFCCDIRTIYYHVENGKPFEGVTFRWAR
jgi:hypothetical protein